MTDKCTICLDREALGSEVPHWDALTPDQQERVIDLVADIADKECGPLWLDGESGRATLARFDMAAARLSAEECARALEGYNIDVSGRLLDEAEYREVVDPYITSHTWTLKGLRHALAREQFIESIMCNVRGVHDRRHRQHASRVGGRPAVRGEGAATRRPPAGLPLKAAMDWVEADSTGHITTLVQRHNAGERVCDTYFDMGSREVRTLEPGEPVPDRWEPILGPFSLTA